MKKTIIIAFVILFSLGIYATDARTHSTVAPYWTIGDDVNILLTPASIFDHPDHVRLDHLLDDRDYNGGLTTTLLPNMKLGIFLGKPYRNNLEMIWDAPGSDTTGVLSNDMEPDRNILDVVLAFRFGGLDIGILANYLTDSYDEHYSEKDIPISVGDYEIGYLIGISEVNFTLDFTLRQFSFFEKFSFLFDYGIPSHEFLEEELVYNGADWDLASWETNTNGAMYLAFRVLFDLGGFNGAVTLQMDKLDNDNRYIVDDDNDGVLETDISEAVQIGITVFEAGVSKKIKTEKFTLCTGGYFRLSKYRYETEEYDNIGTEIIEQWNYLETDVDLPVFAWVEYHLTKWMYLRFGARGELLDSGSDEEDDPDFAAGTNDYTYTELYKFENNKGSYIRLGIGFLFRNITVDLSISPYHLLNPHILTDDQHQPLYRASIKYIWN
ncbi:hypothetical protein KAU32_06140 [bacterium]|nr:hypothetical protein [bacterium]